MVNHRHSDGVTMYYAPTKRAWRQWLSKNHSKEKAVWLIYYKNASGKTRVSYTDAVDEAICFGWIDSRPGKLDALRSMQYFTARNPASKWSTVNRKRALRLIREKRMTSAGLRLVKNAQKKGLWTSLKKVDLGVVPKDLRQELKATKNAYFFFMKFPKSSKKNILEWILNARHPETREKRIKETARMAAHNLRANHYRQPKGATFLQ